MCCAGCVDVCVWILCEYCVDVCGVWMWKQSWKCREAVQGEDDDGGGDDQGQTCNLVFWRLIAMMVP